MHPITAGNRELKYADDFYLIVPASNNNSILSEVEHITFWATCNNLRLNASKTYEMVIIQPGRRIPTVPDPIPSITRVSSLKILGVVFTSNLNFNEHVRYILSAAAQSLYALKILRSRGLYGSNLSNVCRATLVARLTYAVSAWWGYTNAEARSRLQAVLNRAARWGLTGDSQPLSLEDLVQAADKKLFNAVIRDSGHVLHQFLPPPKVCSYQLRARPHNYQLLLKSNKQSRNFLERMLYKDSY